MFGQVVSEIKFELKNDVVVSLKISAYDLSEVPSIFAVGVSWEKSLNSIL